MLQCKFRWNVKDTKAMREIESIWIFTKLRLTLYNRITTVSNLINLMRQNSTIKVLWKSNKVYCESEMAAFDRRHKLLQPRDLTTLFNYNYIKLINLTTILLRNSASSAVHNRICCNSHCFWSEFFEMIRFRTADIWSCKASKSPFNSSKSIQYFNQ